MKEHSSNDRHEEQKHSDDDQLRGNTMNEAIREANGDPDMNLNDIRPADQNMSDRHDSDMEQTRSSNTSQGMDWEPNDASGVRSGGTTDMDDQTSGGAGWNTGVRPGLGSNLTDKRGVTGSDFDGQNSSS